MNPDGVILDRAAVEDALRRLGERLARRGVVADRYVFGGAAMALAYDARRSTRDIDAVLGSGCGLRPNTGSPGVVGMPWPADATRTSRCVSLSSLMSGSIG